MKVTVENYFNWSAEEAQSLFNSLVYITKECNSITDVRNHLVRCFSDSNVLMIYTGGSHIAIIDKTTSLRIAIITEN